MARSKFSRRRAWSRMVLSCSASLRSWSLMIMFCSSLPFYAQAWLPVKLPEHYLPVGGCAALIAAHLYLWLPRAGLAFDAPSVVKAMVAFFAVFMFQFLVCPQFVYDMNFSDGKKLDEFHIFIMRGFGMLGLFFLGLLAQLEIRGQTKEGGDLSSGRYGHLVST